MAGHGYASDASWYRFATAPGAQVRMAASVPAYQRCGTDYPGYYPGPEPGVGEPPIGGIALFQDQHGPSYSSQIELCSCSYDGTAEPM